VVSREKMDNEKASLKKFYRYLRLGQFASVGLFVMGCFFIIGTQDTVLQVTGWIFILMGLVFIFAFNQRKQRLLWIYKNTSPISMKMKLEKKEDSDSTDYFAYLSQEINTSSAGWKTGLYTPSFNVQLFLNNENQVQVYFDPKNNNPAVIKTTQGLLWVMAGSGAVQKL
jgi:hypothetical protein